MIIFLLLLIVACSKNSFSRNTTIEQYFTTVLKQADINQIDLNTVVDFAWEKAYIFQPYTNQEYINEKLGINFKDPSQIGYRDDILLLVFVRNNNVIQYAEIDRQKTNVSIGEKEYLTPSRAVIQITRS